MNIESILPTLLNSLVGGRVYESSTPDDIVRDANDNILDFIIWTIGGGQDSEYVDQTMGSHTNARIRSFTFPLRIDGHCRHPGGTVPCWRRTIL